MPNECDGLYRLEAHYTYEPAFLFPAKESHTPHFVAEFLHRHVWLMIAIPGDNTLVRISGLVYDLVNSIRVFNRKLPDHVLNSLDKRAWQIFR